MPYQPTLLKPFRPDSSIVGVEGIRAARFRLVTPSAFSLPAVSRGCAAVMPGKLNAILPAALSTTTCDDPLYETCTMSALAITLKSSPAKKDELPMPEEPYVSLPGCARASSASA